MTRKDFVADVAAAGGKGLSRVTDIAKGDDDGDVNFNFNPALGPPLEIGLVALDVYKYPTTQYLVFTRSEEPGKVVADLLADVTDSVKNMRIPDAISLIAKMLGGVLAVGSNDDPFTIDEDEMEMDSASECEYEYPDDGMDEDDAQTSNFAGRHKHQDLTKFKRRITHDLRAVHDAGFKLGVLKGMTPDAENSLLSISLRVRRLGLSEEAMQAWDLEPHQYIVLLIRFANGYKTFENAVDEPAKYSGIDFRVGVSNKYKPTVEQAVGAFSEHKFGRDESKENDQPAPTVHASNEAGVSMIFISSSLNQFLQDQFVSLIKIRQSSGLSWEGAKNCFSDMQGRMVASLDMKSKMLYEQQLKDKILPSILLTDHLADQNVKERSLPLLAAQFAFRYLVRCTEFCLVCHDSISEDFEALKPYVCNKPLCLYQYMSLGFGPSVEHELLTQPYVVDLLISFCYVSAMRRRLREYPSGMSLSVPPVTHTVTEITTRGYAAYARSLDKREPLQVSGGISYTVKYDSIQHEVSLDDVVPLRKGDWVLITAVGQSAPTHHRVIDVSPTKVYLANPVFQNASEMFDMYGQPIQTASVPTTPAVTPPLTMLGSALMTIYNENFDEMSDLHKAETIVTLLQTLPSTKELLEYVVQQSRFRTPRLIEWSERISPAALGLLRWIIASNRSCLVQVDKFPGQDGLNAARTKTRVDQKIANVGDDWVQFRFAQGAPDKEQRFLNALRTEQAQLNSRYPTLFAFHGSSVDNWHSIIRHGLDFKETINGRAFGNGVYHACDQVTSTGYARPEHCFWPGSELKITSVMSVNEIVNCPQKFQSSKPYLVVQHIDWIQCRYLLCKTNCIDHGAVFQPPQADFLELRDDVEQDPNYSARCFGSQAIGIPQCAVAISKSFRTKPDEKPRTAKKRLSEPEEDLSSDVDVEDLTFILSDAEDGADKNKGKGKGPDLVFSPSKKQKTSEALTDFVPGSLDQSRLPLLESPTYATSQATRRIQQDLKTILQIQDSTPLHELGWYINPDLISNVYQWIVELHSFEPTLPLAKDLKAASITSIVLEIRFGKAYPHSPPFIRVIRPRFLPFTMGGGGHVTGGGAMCMELLTNSGWSPVSTLESVLLQVRMALMNLEPKPARLENRSLGGQRDYGTGEAMEAYIRACRTHGWQVPEDFQDFGKGVVDRKSMNL